VTQHNCYLHTSHAIAVGAIKKRNLSKILDNQLPTSQASKGKELFIMKVFIRLATLAAFACGLTGVIVLNHAYDSFYGAVGLTITSVIFLATNPTTNK
jgi:hypothetical protein